MRVERIVKRASDFAQMANQVDENQRHQLGPLHDVGLG